MNWSFEQSKSTIVAVLIGVVGISLWWWLQQPQSFEGIVLEATSTPLETASVTVIVDVQGKVNNPGIVELPAGSRVIDAIEMAGGLLPKVVPGINLARIVLDGEQIVIGSAPEISEGKINLNTASATDLETIPGVGPVLASRIIEYRQSHGSFRSFEDVDLVSGVGPSLLNTLKEHASI
jgi:competence protein ComEA